MAKSKRCKMAKEKRFKCKQCGRCCLKYGHLLQALPKDIERWERQGRTDILAWVERMMPFPNRVHGDLWINQKTQREAQRCPWLRKLPNKRKYICRIYDVRPEVCRDYPVSRKQALKDRCRG